LRITLLVADIHLPGCRSLKEKRRRLSGIKEKLGRQPNLAVCESELNDEHQWARWSFVAISRGTKTVDKILANVETLLEEEIDATLLRTRREEL